MPRQVKLFTTSRAKAVTERNGTANPAIAKMMKVGMQDLKSAEVQAMSDDDLKKTIADGKGKIRPLKTVSGPALDDVVAYVRSLKK
jgi:hypothetical protein